MSGRFFAFILLISMAVQTEAQPWIHYYPAGSVHWANSVTPTYDGGYIISGPNKISLQPLLQSYLIKLNNDGNILWKKTVGVLSDYCFSLSIIPSFDNGFLLGGYCLKYDPNGAAFIMKFNSCAEMEWTKEYGIFNNYEFIGQLSQSPDGNYIASASYFGYSVQDSGRVGLLKIDPSGNVIWEKDFTHGINADILTHTVLDNGDIIISSRNFDGMANAELIRVDSAGNELWYQYYGIPNFISSSLNVMQTPDSGFLSLALSGPTGQKRWSYLIKTDALGNEQWSKFISDTTTDQSEWPNRILKVSDSTAIITMVVYQYSTIPNQTYTLKAVKIDFQGNVIDSIKFGTGHNQLQNSIVDRDNNVLVCGSHNSNQPFLIRIRPDLQIDTMLFLPAVYDSLCSYPITDGFVPYDTAAVGITETGYSAKVFEIYPNPASSQLTLQYSPPKTTGLATVYNVLGEAVHQLTLPPNTTRQQLNIALLPAGLYLIKVESDGKRGVKRFVRE